MHSIDEKLKRPYWSSREAQDAVSFGDLARLGHRAPPEGWSR